MQLVVEDRYLHSAVAGLALAAAAGVAALHARWRDRAGLRLLPALVLAVAIVAAAAAHTSRLTYWHDGATYWSEISRQIPPVPGDAWSQELCVRAARAHAFRYAGPDGTGRHTVDDWLAVLDAAGRCDPELAPVQQTIAHAARRLAESGLTADQVERQIEQRISGDALR